MDHNRYQQLLDSFDIVNHLFAGFMSRQECYSILAEHVPSAGIEAELEKSRRIIAEIDEWGQAMWQGNFLGGPEGGRKPTPAMSRGIGLLEALSGDFESFASHLERVLDLGVEKIGRTGIVNLAAAFYRVNLREFLMHQGFLRFAEKTGNSEMLAHYRESEAEVRRMKDSAEQLRGRLAGREWDGLSRWKLYIKARSFPGLFRVQRVDTRYLIMQLKRDEAPAGFGVSAEELAAFREAGYDAYAAAAWSAMGLGAADAAAWRAEGLDHPAIAADWSCRGFGLSEALVYIDRGVSAEDAAYERALKEGDQGGG